MSEPLDPLNLPLQGSRLIEASAGTGKTWTMAALYVRLVLGHHCQPRLPAEILGRWHYDAERSQDLWRRDRSASGASPTCSSSDRRPQS